MKTEIPYDFMPPEQHFGSPEELLSAINRYQQTRDLVDRDDRLSLPDGMFEKLEDGEGRYVLIPATTDLAFLFRGQSAFYKECLPTLQRRVWESLDLFIERMRVVEFELMLKQYPAVQYFSREHLIVDYVGLAQHYGLLTDVLDLTSDLHTALFFAMCDYNSANDCYTAKKDDKEHIGYLYAYPAFASAMQHNGSAFGRFLKEDLRVIGLQPFIRPGAQKGFSLHVSQNNPFKGYLYSFSYTKQDSEQYLDKMVNGRQVWAKDYIVERTKLIRDTTKFSFDALYLAVKRYGGGITLAKMQRQLNAVGIHFSNDLPWNLTDAENQEMAAVFEKELKSKLLAQMAQRTLKVEDKTFFTSSLQFVASQLLLQTLQGGFPSVDGYDSGIAIFIEGTDEQPIVGWSYNTGRPQTVPDKTGKVTCFDQILKDTQSLSPESIARREAIKSKIDSAVEPFRMRKVPAKR